MLQFDEKGHLVPYEIAETMLEEFQSFFVEGLPDQAHRRRLFENYLQYLEALKVVVNQTFVQWVDGSFATRKQKPGDIDLVNFIDYRVVEQHEQALKLLSRTPAFEMFQVDANIVKVYPEGHPKAMLTKSDRLYWEHQFGYTPKNRSGKRFQKGFIKISF
ncbi:MAG: hypothetical protein EPO28_09255 [Saprospiraceae bacterium]|nr:MAG: hypothetical protein EPO28_09255 [Saprospiraceae bacterium]